MKRRIHGETGKQFPTYRFFPEKSIRKMEKQRGSRIFREPLTIKYGFLMKISFFLHGKIIKSIT
ncbi:hypothetical protein CXU10_08640 [Akkermansia muciniphila]|nr:hypothetical protein CXU10_08640 [Akkermansia muciniphila]